MKYWLVCDYREQFENLYKINPQINSDHPNKKNMQEIFDAIKFLGHNCEYFGGIPELINAVEKKAVFSNAAFLNFTDGMEQAYSRVQAPVLLDILNVPYSGSDVFSSVIMNNKHYCKKILQDSDIPAPKSVLINQLIPFNKDQIKDWIFPVFIKPNCEGSSIGINNDSVCFSMDEVEKKISQSIELFEEIIIEEYVPGIDITNYLIGNTGDYYINDIVAIKLFDQSPFAVYDSEAKHKKLREFYFNEEIIPIKTVQEIQLCSEKIAQIVGARDICRIDYRLNMETQKFSFIEINSAPRFSSTSEIGFIASKKELNFSNIVFYYLQSFNKRILNEKVF